MKIYSHDCESRQMVIYSRSDKNEVVATLEGIDTRTSHLIAKALDLMFHDGVKNGKAHVLNAVHTVTSRITV